jgi:hypothetical protein
MIDYDDNLMSGSDQSSLFLGPQRSRTLISSLLV